HVMRHTDSSGGILEWPQGSASIENSTAVSFNAEFVENFVGVAKVCLTQGDTAAEMAEFLARLFDRIRILIELENVRTGFQNRFGMTAAANRSIDNQRAGVGRE